jgi:exonuclease SbcC
VIPLKLKISGFLSYRDPAEVDFSGFDLACISGHNGAGKSSLLDAITWVLFGQARKRDESLINLQAKTAEVSLTFQYEQVVYRVVRSLTRGRTTVLEFQIRQLEKEEWRPLTERTLRETQARIEQILRLDYGTFVNVSFFLQGRADQFAQQPPTQRKQILGNILGLEDWELYRERTVERRRAAETGLAGIDSRLQEIESELAEEAQRKQRLAELEQQLAGQIAGRKLQENSLASLKKVQAGLEKQRELVQRLGETLERARSGLSVLQERQAGREQERERHAQVLQRSAAIEAAYASWQAVRLALEGWEQTSGKYHAVETRRRPLLESIAAEKARLEQEQKTLLERAEATSRQAEQEKGLAKELEAARQSLKLAEERLAEKARLEAEMQAARERHSALQEENRNLNGRMKELKERIDRLGQAEGVSCPLCGQALSPEHRRSTLDQLQAEGKQMGDAFRENRAALEALAGSRTSIEKALAGLAPAEHERNAHDRLVAQLVERQSALQAQAAEWEKGGARRLKELEKTLTTDKFAVEERKELRKVDKELAALGYDAAAHDAARRSEQQQRAAETELRALEAARAALKPIEDELASLEKQIDTDRAGLEGQEKEYQAANEALLAAQAEAPDLETAERELFAIQEQENRLNQEVGAARQKVAVLEDQRQRKLKLEAERAEIGLSIGRYKSLERAFSRDGVPALLIEQALPEIELKANEILGRLSDDTMHITFATQAKYKDEKRKDLRETLEIQVSDGAGQRDYELFSGGEAFRVNFAIRLALSEVLAARKGARLQMLVIDEGFGSQDALGRQRLIQAINAVRPDFAKILVITHLEELKDAFPNRIEVEKTEGGSAIQVL